MIDTTVPNEYDLAPLEFADEIETDTAQVLANVASTVQDIIWQRKKPRLSIPVQYTDDDLVIGGAINQAEKDLKEAARLIRDFVKERQTILSLIERNEHNYHRLGALGSTDMKIIMEILRE